MNDYPFPFHGAALLALQSGALHWPQERLLVVSDLHFGKPDRIARRGGTLLPPYATQDTLLRLEAIIEQSRATTVIALGDSFDDLQAADDLAEAERLWLTRLMAGRRWIWIAGNHDPAPQRLGGSHLASFRYLGLTFRHIADPATTGEVSGHYHPKARLAAHGHGMARPCFLLDETRIILPAFGTYTGGLACDAPELLALMQPGALAVLTGPRVLTIPMPRPQGPAPALSRQGPAVGSSASR